MRMSIGVAGTAALAGAGMFLAVGENVVSGIFFVVAALFLAAYFIFE